MITDFINNVIIIDDKQEEVEGLLKTLKNQDISYSSFTPINIKNISFKKNRQLIFLDLSLDDSKKMIENIALIRSLLKNTLGKNFGIYGIVVWSKHQRHVDLLKEKLQEDRKNMVYSTPIFVVTLDKTKYIKQGNYNDLLNDIETILTNDSAATFFLEWSNSVQQAKDKTIENIYSLMPDYEKQSDDIIFILTKLALNYTGIDKNIVNNYPLHIDAFKAFDEILYGELINSHKSNNINIVDTAKIFSNPNDLIKIYAQLNSAMFIDYNNIVQGTIIPGNIYEQVYNNKLLNITGSPKKAKKIIIEITPPCDFANRKGDNPRIVSGFMFDWPSNEADREKILKAFNGESKYKIYPINIFSIAQPQFICFDFRYTTAISKQDLEDSTKYKTLFRAKPKLFADILQKFSAHAARLGLSVINS